MFPAAHDVRGRHRQPGSATGGCSCNAPRNPTAPPCPSRTSCAGEGLRGRSPRLAAGIRRTGRSGCQRSASCRKPANAEPRPVSPDKRAEGTPRTPVARPPAEAQDQGTPVYTQLAKEGAARGATIPGRPDPLWQRLASPEHLRNETESTLHQLHPEGNTHPADRTPQPAQPEAPAVRGDLPERPMQKSSHTASAVEAWHAAPLQPDGVRESLSPYGRCDRVSNAADSVARGLPHRPVSGARAASRSVHSTTSGVVVAGQSSTVPSTPYSEPSPSNTASGPCGKRADRCRQARRSASASGDAAGRPGPATAGRSEPWMSARVRQARPQARRTEPENVFRYRW